jgi:Protein of unknown function (DUF2851)
VRLSACETEAALVARWAAGALVGRWLRTAEGEEIGVIFPGRPGGPAGPDFRDAVLVRHDGTQVCGDVELHVQARGWQAHGHAHDPRYDRVVLHIVRYAEGVCATPLASGGWAPVVELEPDGGTPNTAIHSSHALAAGWPCADLTRRLKPAGVHQLLSAAGDARFDGRAGDFTRRLVEATAPHLEGDGGTLAAAAGDACEHGAWSEIDRVLCVALAEGLAYGREREPLRRAGEWLAAGGSPEVLLRELPRLSSLDAARLEGLLALQARWADAGPWKPLRAALLAGTPASAARALIAALSVPEGSVSADRAAILAANVVLPCAAAWAALRGDGDLAARARAVYVALPGLPSNQITREMVRHLGLSRQPAGARAQQGLHHIWAQHCREKRCAGCPCALRSGTQ